MDNECLGTQDMIPCRANAVTAVFLTFLERIPDSNRYGFGGFMPW